VFTFITIHFFPSLLTTNRYKDCVFLYSMYYSAYYNNIIILHEYPIFTFKYRVILDKHDILKGDSIILNSVDFTCVCIRVFLLTGGAPLLVCLRASCLLPTVARLKWLQRTLSLMAQYWSSNTLISDFARALCSIPWRTNTHQLKKVLQCLASKMYSKSVCYYGKHGVFCKLYKPQKPFWIKCRSRWQMEKF